jgi:hypothetical protein
MTWTKVDIKRLKAADTNFVKENKTRDWGVKERVRSDNTRQNLKTLLDINILIHGKIKWHVQFLRMSEI